MKTDPKFISRPPSLEQIGRRNHFPGKEKHFTCNIKSALSAVLLYYEFMAM